MCNKIFTHTHTLIFAIEREKYSAIIQSFFLNPDRDHTARLTEFYGIVHNIRQDSAKIYRISNQSDVAVCTIFPVNLIPDAFLCSPLIINLVQFPQYHCQIKQKLLVLQISAL